jgi:hypothetical protein
MKDAASWNFGVFKVLIESSEGRYHKRSRFRLDLERRPVDAVDDAVNGLEGMPMALLSQEGSTIETAVEMGVGSIGSSFKNAF